MTTEAGSPTGTPYASAWRRIVVDPRSAMWQFTRDAVVPISAFLFPLLVIVLVQCYSVGCSLLLGWDSSTYAWWAVQVQQEGALSMVLRWHYPNLYVLILSGFGSAIGSVSTAEHILPLLVSVPLGYSYSRLTAWMTSNRRLGLFAAFLGGVSVATLEMISDLHRNLLALGIALPLGASIYMDLLVRTSNPKQLRNRAVAVWVPLLLVVLATQVETYGVLSITLLLASASSRRWSKFLRCVVLVSAPVLILSPLLIGWFSIYGSETAKLVPFGPSVIVTWVWLYLSGLAIPLIGVGILSLTRAARTGDPIARYLMLWLVTLAILVLPAFAINAPPTRLLFFIPVPTLLALAARELGRWLTRIWDGVRSRRSEPGRPHSAIRREPVRDPLVSNRTRLPVSLIIAFLLVATPIVATTAANKNQLRPYVNEADVHRLEEAAAILRANGYRDAILVLYGPDAAVYAPLYRAYFGIQVPDNLAYYGKLQFLFSLPDPVLAYSWKYDAPLETSYSTNLRNEILEMIGESSVLSHPILVAGGATYTAARSEAFLGRFEAAPGIYLIPPGALSALDVDSWRLFVASDCYVCGLGSSIPTSWSRAPNVLEYVDLANSAAFDSTYILSLVRGWGNGNLTIRFWDWPAMLPYPGTGNVTLAPLEVYFDGTRIVNHSYADLGPVSITLPTGPLSAGIHRVELRSGSPGLGVAVRLDDVELVPSS